MIKFNKNKLRELYIKQKLFTSEIAKIYKCDDTTINKRLKRYNIKLRTISEALKIRYQNNPKSHPSYKTGKYMRKHYCKNCKKEISEEAKRCASCATKYNFKIGKLNTKGKNNGNFGKKNRLATHHKDGNHFNNNNKNNKLKLSNSKHRQLHERAYNYLAEIGLIKKYIKWFDKTYKLGDIE